MTTPRDAASPPVATITGLPRNSGPAHQLDRHEEGIHVHVGDRPQHPPILGVREDAQSARLTM